MKRAYKNMASHHKVSIGTVNTLNIKDLKLLRISSFKAQKKELLLMLDVVLESIINIYNSKTFQNLSILELIANHKWYKFQKTDFQRLLFIKKIF